MTADRESLVSAAPPEGMVEEIERLSEKATAGKWHLSGTHIDMGDDDASGYIVAKRANAKANIEFVAALVNAWRSGMLARPVAAPLREQIIEECAKLCDEQEAEWRSKARDQRASDIEQAVLYERLANIARNCAGAIRALSAAPNNAGRRETMQRDRAKDQPGLHMAAQEACVTMYTDGFCVARQQPNCTRCWPAAESVIKATGMSPRAVTWIFAHRTRIEEMAKIEYNGHIAFRANGNAVAGESPDARDARWISVSERLPDSEDDVLVWHVLGDRGGSPRAFDVAAYIKGEWIFPWDRGLHQNPPPQWVTHWKQIDPPGSNGQSNG